MITTVLGVMASLLFSGCYIPQIIKLIKSKESNDISPTMYGISLAAYVLSIVYVIGSVGWNWVLLLNYFSGVIMCIITLYLTMKYKK